MKIIEILLPKGASDRSLSPQVVKKLDMIQKRMDSYVDKIMSPNTSSAGKEFLKSRLRDEYLDLKDTIARVHVVAEAIHKCPLTEKDFDLVKKLMEKPIPAVIASIYIHEIIEDDELNDQLKILEDSEPNRDIRPLIAEWFERVMPDQMYRFTDDVPDYNQQKGMTSVIHGFDSKSFRSRNDSEQSEPNGRY